MMRTRWLLSGCCAIVIACGGDDDGGASDDAGTGGAGSGGSMAGSGGSTAGSGGSTAGSGGSMAGSGGSMAGSGGSMAGSGGSTAGSGGSMAGSGGSMAGSGGSAGSAGSMAGSGGGTDLSDVDLTLDGFNQDLAEPPTDCLTAESTIGCVSVRGTYNDEDFDATCHDDNSLGSGVVIGGYHFVNCQFDLLDGIFSLNLLLGQELLDPLPIAYEWQAPDGRKYVNYSHDTRGVSSHRGEDFQLGDTHEQELAVAGAASLRDGPVAGQVSVWVEGAFAGNLTAKPGCTPDAMGYGCDTIRFRGSYAAFTENDVEP